jgi:hypothetical protein
MDLQSTDSSGPRFAAYVEGLVSVIGHADRAGPLKDYCNGLDLIFVVDDSAMSFLSTVVHFEPGSPRATVRNFPARRRRSVGWKALWRRREL